MGSKQIKNVALTSMVVGGIILCVSAVMVLASLIADDFAIFSFLCGASNLFYGFTVFRAVTDAEPDQATFHGLLKRCGSSWLVPLLMTAAPFVTEKTFAPVPFACGVCALFVSVMLDLCLRNAAKGR